MFDDVTFQAVHSALSGLSQRQRAIADNVANLNTPGFLASRVQFEDALKGAIGGGSGVARATVARSLEPTREDGNNVNLDRESLLGIDTSMRQQLMMRAIDGRFSSLRTAFRSA